MLSSYVVGLTFSYVNRIKGRYMKRMLAERHPIVSTRFRPNSDLDPSENPE